MVEYRKPPAKSLTIVQQDEEGRKRTVTAVCINEKIGQWDLETENPSGERWTRREMAGSDEEVTLLAAAMLNRYAPEYRHDRNREHKPRSPMLRDTSVRVGASPISYSDQDNRFNRRPR